MANSTNSSTPTEMDPFDELMKISAPMAPDSSASIKRQDQNLASLNETAEIKADLKRRHPDLTDEEIDEMLNEM